ncbi:RimK family protein [Wenzhouxiangella sediminis]|uniref:ATP-grasp domain-containing protein n=1 Tax=Wenzhouxiangella sediminis TaxID=1792836 RepID=A0A3E1KCL8_9GAMM|nr:RimK family protein [Wenzhouxiangella sediminis]RFF32714.1 ATP-grasp domain-containing protein [Wenzhouxiangella sediminis]
MQQLIVVSRAEDWPLEIEGVERVLARDYLTDPGWSERRSTRVYNLCRSYGYQSNGYYVSLLAAARGHKPLPSVATLQDFKAPNIVRMTGVELARLIETGLKPLQSDEFTLSIYFGRNLARRYDRLSRALFNLFPAPLLRARFQRLTEGWALKRIAPISFSDIPDTHLDFVREAAGRYFSGKRPRAGRSRVSRFDLAMLVNAEEAHPPSDEKALSRFERAGEAVGFHVERVGPDEIGRLAEFDALFIRETTAVNHHTFRFARKAAAEGLVVIDDPDSILKCTNKVYLAELLQRHGIAAPRTLLVHRDNAAEIESRLGLPVVLKQPDSAFSLGVVKIEDRETLECTVRQMLRRSELIVAQEYLPTAFDWRVGVIDGRALYVCRYHMARGHWQIINHEMGGGDEGMADTLTVGEAPESVVHTAVKAAGLIGNGLYGVDLKEVDGRVLVIEINDNPSIDAGCEDAVLKDALYRDIMGVMFKRVTERKLGRASLQ